MKLWRVAIGTVALVCLVWAGLVLPAQAFQEKDGAATFVWKGFNVDPEKGKESYFQKLETSTTQTMQVVDKGGQPAMTQTQKQTFIIQCTPKAKEGGNYVLEQQIVYVNMAIQIGTTQISYDSDNTAQPKNPMTDFFTQLMNVKLTLVIDPATMKVTDVKNQREFIDKLGESHPQMKNLLKSILGDQAIKTMSQQTWASVPLPPKNVVKKGDKWSSEAKLSMPAIGLYDNKYDYVYDGMEGGKYKILVTPTMNYKPPTETPSKDDALAFKIKGDSKLDSVPGKDTTGTVLFDPASGRIESSVMKMKVTGIVVIEIGGTDTKVKLDQDQESKLTTGTKIEDLKKKGS